MKIVLPYLKETELMKRALKSLEETLPKGTTITLLHDSERKGFVPMIIRAMKETEEDIIIWHTDMIAIPGWYEKLKVYMEMFPEAIIGPKLLYPNRTIQSAGGFILSNGFCSNVGSTEIDFGQYDIPQPRPFVTFAGVLIRKSAIDKIGYLDENFSPLYYDDVDYCLRARENGIPVISCPIELIHLESQTTRQMGINGEKNFNYFKAKWMPVLAELIK